MLSAKYRLYFLYHEQSTPNNVYKDQTLRLSILISYPTQHHLFHYLYLSFISIFSLLEKSKTQGKMQFQIISLLALAAATSAVPVTSAFKDKCGNSDANRACLIGLDQLGHNVAFTVEIGVNANNVNSVLGA